MGPGPSVPPLDTSDESDMDTEPLAPQPNPSQPWWNAPESRNSAPDGTETEGDDDDDDDDDEESYEDYVSDVVLQVGAGDNTISSSDTEVEEPEDESEDDSEDEPENQPSPRLDGGRRGVIIRPEGHVRRNLGPELELQPPGVARPPPVNANGYNVGIRGPVLPRPQPQQLQQQQQQQLPRQQLPRPQLPQQQQQQQPPPPNQPRPELQPQGRHRPIREQMAELLGYVN